MFIFHWCTTCILRHSVNFKIFPSIHFSSIFVFPFPVAIKYGDDVIDAIAGLRSDEDETNWYNDVG